MQPKSFYDIQYEARHRPLPVTARELLVTKSFITRNDLKWKVGDTVTLPFTTYSADPQVEPETAQRTYTICGILENDNQLTGFTAPFAGWMIR